jgi:hypothetical protein
VTAGTHESVDLQAVLGSLTEMRRTGDIAGMERIRAALTPGQVAELQKVILGRLSDRMTQGVIEYLGGRLRPVVTVEPLTDALRANTGRRYDPHQFAVVERTPRGGVVVHDTANSEWHARTVAESYVATHDAVLALTPLQIARDDVLIDNGHRHTVTSVYPVEPLSITVHTDTWHKLYTWSEANTLRFTVDVRAGDR